MVIALVTGAAFYLNAVFAIAISRPGKPTIGPAFTLARRHLTVVLGIRLRRRRGAGGGGGGGAAVGAAWFTLSLGIVIWVMMLTYVTVPARIVGIKVHGSRRDKLTAALIGALREHIRVARQRVEVGNGNERRGQDRERRIDGRRAA